MHWTGVGAELEAVDPPGGEQVLEFGLVEEARGDTLLPGLLGLRNKLLCRRVLG